jgi:hypothetical protein
MESCTYREGAHDRVSLKAGGLVDEWEQHRAHGEARTVIAVKQRTRNEKTQEKQVIGITKLRTGGLLT